MAHNSCILNDLVSKDNKYPVPFKVVNYLKRCGIVKEMRTKKMSNSRIRQITYTLYMFNKIVTSDDIKEAVKKEINELFYDRIIYHKEYYSNNELLKSVYSFFDKIVKKMLQKYGKKFDIDCNI